MIEKYYRRIIDGVPSAVFVADQNLKAVFCNSKFAALFGRGFKRATLGAAVGCAGDCKRCGRSECAKGCSLI
ncbi:MAG: PAS domain-containing protein, partial [Clostridia bacterium]|nr:PAS domain-containing protein [Clostridia bacterium]